jgi:hypothetical protein
MTVDGARKPIKTLIDPHFWNVGNHRVSKAGEVVNGYSAPGLRLGPGSLIPHSDRSAADPFTRASIHNAEA